LHSSGSILIVDTGVNGVKGPRKIMSIKGNHVKEKEGKTSPEKREGETLHQISCYYGKGGGPGQAVCRPDTWEQERKRTGKLSEKIEFKVVKDKGVCREQEKERPWDQKGVKGECPVLRGMNGLVNTA